MVAGRVEFHSNFGAFKRNRHSKTVTTYTPHLMRGI